MYCEHKVLGTNTKPKMIEKDREKVLIEGIEEGFYPRYLYKYWSFDSAKRFLANGKIRYSSCYEFNDPFEGSFGLIGNVTQEEIQTFIEKMVPVSSQTYLNEDIPYDVLKNFTRNIIKDAIGCVGIFCLAEKNTNLLMWAHYAHEHEGVCLKFDLLKDTNAFSSLHKVGYTTDYQNFNFVTDLSRVNDILTHKSVDWMYEKEYRVLKLNKVGLGNVKPEALVEIDFGCRMDKKHKEEIKNLVASNPNYNVQFKQAGMHSNDYSILICEEDDQRIYYNVS